MDAGSAPARDYTEAVAVSRIKWRLQREREEQRRRAGLRADAQCLYRGILAGIDSGRIVNGTVAVSVRLHYGCLESMHPLLDELLLANGLRINRIDDDAALRMDDCGCCLISSVFFCCLPALYFVPKWTLDEVYGKVHVLRVSLSPVL